MPLVNGLVGFFILIIGRQFYPIFTGGMFTLIVMNFGSFFPFIDSLAGRITLAILVGLAAAILTIPLKRYMAAVAGFFGGGFTVMWLPQFFGWPVDWLSNWTFIAAGLISAALIFLILDYSLVILSTVLGAVLVAQSLRLQDLDSITVFFVLLFIGLLVQIVMLQYGRGYPD